MFKCGIIWGDILDAARHRSAEEERICPRLLGFCGLIGKAKLENVKEQVW